MYRKILASVVFLLIAVMSCMRLVHVDPALRDKAQSEDTLVHLYITCSEPYPFKSGDPTDPANLEPDIVWYGPRVATGIIISERQILTAAHAVTCPTFPRVIATLSDGRKFQMAVTEDDIMFGQGKDIARLEIATAEYFHINIPPPLLGDVLPGEDVVAYEWKRGCIPGKYKGNNLFDLSSYPGDSGAPIFNMRGQLVGLISQGSTPLSLTKREVVEPRWLNGT
jgi:S1-C subfamily serine protease